MIRISILTALFLVLLRVAIGYHFLGEGAQKILNTHRGKTVTSRPFSSEGYFRTATGPLGPYARERLVDPDDQTLVLFDVKPIPAGVDKKDADLASLIPPALGAEWAAYLERFAAYYQLSPEQKDQAKKKLDESKKKTVEWMMTGKKTLKRTFGGKADEMELTTPQRVLDYRLKLAELREGPNRRWQMGRDVEKEATARLRGEVNTMRTELTEDLDKQTGDMKKALGEVVKGRADAAVAYVGKDEKDPDAVLLPYLTLGPAPAGKDGLSVEQLPGPLVKAWQNYLDALVEDFKLPAEKKTRGQEKLAEVEDRMVVWLADQQSFVGKYREQSEKFKALPEDKEDPKWKAEAESLKKTRDLILGGLKSRTDEMKQYIGAAILNEYQQKAEPPPPEETHGLVWWLDRVTEWGLTIVGLCLMIGLLTRLSCILAVAFLLTTYLLAPPWAWLPVPLQTEGNPLYVNKNLIEMLALLALATTASGRWFGVDPLLRHFWRKDRAEKAKEPETKPK
jgi:uncharacterized membrane protein YphA (DoxX/SURF4 family)